MYLNNMTHKMLTHGISIWWTCALCCAIAVLFKRDPKNTQTWSGNDFLLEFRVHFLMDGE